MSNKMGAKTVIITLLLTNILGAATLNVPGTYSTIQAAVNAANPGDTVLVAFGSYTGWRATLASGLQRSGTQGSPITVTGTTPTLASATYVSGITASGTGTCSLSNFSSISAFGSGATATIAISSGTPGAITITAAGSGYQYPPNTATVTSGTATCSGTPVLTSTLNETLINVANSDGNAVSINSLNYYTVSNFFVSGSMTLFNIDVVSCEGCQIIHNATSLSPNANILVGFCYDCIIRYNTTYQAGGSQHGIYVSNSARGYDGPLVSDNETFNNTGAGIQLNGDCQTPNNLGQTDGVIEGALIQNNYIANNGGNGLSLINVWNSTIRNNVLVNNSAAGSIKFADQAGCNTGSNYNVVSANTIANWTGTVGAGIRIVNNTNGTPFVGNVAFNNLIVSTTYKCVIDSSAANCDDSGTGGMYYLPAYEASSPISPLFINYLLGTQAGFNLQAGSPAINTGVASTTGANGQSYNAPVVDIQGALRSGRYDAGAYEQGASPSPPNTTPPTTPGTPTALIGATNVALSWTASTDLREILWYVVWRDGVPYANSYSPNYTDPTPPPSTVQPAPTPGSTHTYVIYALDGSWLYSASSGTTSATLYGIVGCMNADNTFRYVLTPNETGTFIFNATATPFASSTTDGFIGLSPAPPIQFSGWATIVAFSNTGNVLVRNGGSYTSDVTYPWTSGTTYSIVETVNIPSHTYTVTISTGGTPTTIATNYAFRTEQSLATSIGYLGTTDDATSGSVATCIPAVNGILLDGLQFVPTLVQSLYTQSITPVNLNANGSGFPLFDTPFQPALTGSRLLSVLDRAGMLVYSGSTGITVTVPTGLGAGFSTTLIQAGTGSITLAGSGLTLHQFNPGLTSAGQYAAMVVQCNVADSCIVWGQGH